MPARIAVNSHTNQVYVTLGNHVTVLKGTELIADVHTGHGLGEALAIDEANDWVYVVNEYSDSVSIIRGTELITHVATVGSAPKAVAIGPSRQQAYVVSFYKKRPDGQRQEIEGNILVLNGSKVVTNLTFERIPFRHVVADSNGYIYAGAAGGTIVVLKDLQEVGRYEGILVGGIRSSIVSMEANPQTGEVYTLDSANRVRKFKEGKLLEEVEIANSMNNSYELIRLHPTTGTLHLLNRPTREVVTLNAWQSAAHIPVGERAIRMKIDPFTGNVYVVNFYSSSITAINDTKVLDTIKTGWLPSDVGINPNNGMVYVVNTGDQTISVLGYPPPNFTPPAPTQAPTAPTAPTRAPTRPYP
jgi:DNA-binding beta-propeller fold protein YncE